MMTKNETTLGWACTDCLILIANGESPPEMTEEQEAEWLADIQRRNEGYDITSGMMADEHDSDCPNQGEWPEAWCSCEEREFSWQSCDVCGSTLGGSRHAVTFWTKS